ncbi:MAG: YciI family protein [Geminicoccaceae bacterium]
MQYALLIYVDESAYMGMTPEQQKTGTAAYEAYTAALLEAGAMVGGQRLMPSAAATRVHVAAGSTQVLDGPYAETKEQLGGFYLIEAPDLDAAIKWAARCPGASHGTVEVRPLFHMGG